MLHRPKRRRDRLCSCARGRPAKALRSCRYRSLNLRQVERRPALPRATAPWIFGPLGAAQAMHGEAPPMRPPQGETAILEAEDAVLTVLIAPKSMRSEAHSELHMGSAQTAAILDRALDHSHAC